MAASSGGGVAATGSAADSLAPALDAGDGAALETALARNIYNATDIHSGARRLTAYTREAASTIGTQDALPCGEVRFPDPDAVAPL